MTALFGWCMASNVVQAFDRRKKPSTDELVRGVFSRGSGTEKCPQLRYPLARPSIEKRFWLATTG
jgi:hypothetical protein